MKRKILSLQLGLLFATSSIFAQSAPPSGPSFDNATAKVFGDNQSFSATVEFTITDTKKGDSTTMPGKFAFDSGKTRFEMNMSELKGNKTMSANDAAQMKEMGMDSMVSISRQDKKMTYLIYPGLKSYVESPIKTKDTSAAASDFKTETTEIGKETIDGHPCVKNKVTVTYKSATSHEFTTWNATDLKNFPVKVESTEGNNDVVMLFKNTSLAKPDASLFEPPTDYTKYDSAAAMMRAEMMKKMGGGAGAGGNGGGLGGLGGLRGLFGK